MSTYLITGCSRGLGLAFVKELVEGEHASVRLVIATSRNPQAPAALQAIIDSAPDRVKHVSLDVTDQASINEAVKTVQDILGKSGLDVLINNAGITKVDVGRTNGMTSENLLNILTTNVVAVHNVTQGFLPLLKAGTSKKVINITSTLGSIGMTLNYSDIYKNIPTPSYNISKAALNSLTAQYTIDLKDEGFTFLTISPGHLQTDLGGMNAPLTADVGAKATLKIIQEASVKDSGRFRNIYVENDRVHNGEDPVW